MAGRAPRSGARDHRSTSEPAAIGRDANRTAVLNRHPRRHGLAAAAQDRDKRPEAGVDPFNISEWLAGWSAGWSAVIVVIGGKWLHFERAGAIGIDRHPHTSAGL